MEKQKTKPATPAKGKGHSNGRKGEETKTESKNLVQTPKAPSAQVDKDEDRSKDRAAASRTQHRVTNADEQKRTVNSAGNDASVDEDEEFENEIVRNGQEEDEDEPDAPNSVDDPSKESNDSEKIKKEQPKMS